MDIKNSDTVDTDMTYLTGYVTATYDQLVRVFGEPTYNNEDPYDKVQTEWMLEIDGVVATIYNWKMGFTPKGLHDWHIGGFDRGEVVKVKKALAGV